MSVALIPENDHLLLVVHSSRIDGDNKIFMTVKQSDLEPGIFASIEIDLQAVVYLNSLGIAEIISVFRYFKGEREKLKMVLKNVDASIAKLFDVVELAHVFEIQLKP